MPKKKDVLTGFKQALPIVMGYLPIGVAYGILAVRNGLTRTGAVMMSIFVFAGSSQLICVEMIGKGAAILAIIFMTFLVNLRHLLMGASLSLHFKTTPARYLPFVSFLITDESFAVGSTGIKNHQFKAGYFLGLGVTAYLGWVGSSWLGAGLSGLIPELEVPALDFVLPSMFIVLLVLQVKNKLDVLVALMAGGFSLFFLSILPGNWNIILATIVAATLGVVLEKWIQTT